MTELPSLAELRDIDAINAELDLQVPAVTPVPAVSATTNNDVESDENSSLSEESGHESETDKTSEVVH